MQTHMETFPPHPEIIPLQLINSIRRLHEKLLQCIEYRTRIILGNSKNFRSVHTTSDHTIYHPDLSFLQGFETTILSTRTVSSHCYFSVYSNNLTNRKTIHSIFNRLDSTQIITILPTQQDNHVDTSLNNNLLPNRFLPFLSFRTTVQNPTQSPSKPHYCTSQ